MRRRTGTRPQLDGPRPGAAQTRTRGRRRERRPAGAGERSARPLPFRVSPLRPGSPAAQIRPIRVTYPSHSDKSESEPGRLVAS